MAVTTPAPVGRKARRRGPRLTRRDKLILAVMIAVPTLLRLALIWVPTTLSVVLSFARWDGIGGLDTIKWVKCRRAKACCR